MPEPIKVDAIKTQDELKAYLAAEAEGKLAMQKKMDEQADELKKLKEDTKASADKIAEVTSKNWVEKYSTAHGETAVREETLYNMGHYFKGIITRNPEEVRKFGRFGEKGGTAYMDKIASKAWDDGGDSQWRRDAVTKDAIGTPLYSDATTGSYLVPVEYAAEVMRISKQASQMMGLVREVPMKGITKYVPYADTVGTCYWLTAQSSTKTENNPTFNRTTLTSQTMGIYASVVDEFDEDSLVNIAAYFRDIFGEAWGYEFDLQCTAANAAPFTGMLHGATAVYTLGAGQTSFQDIAFDDLYDAVAELTTENKRIGGRFIMHITIFDILRKIKNANGDYLYQKPDGQQPGTLAGYPYTTCDAMTSVSSDNESTKFIVFGNPKFMIYGNRVGASFDVFDRTYARATDDQILFRYRARAAFAIGLGGAAHVAIRTAAA